MSSLAANYVDGVLQTNPSSAEGLTSSSSNNNSTISSDTFLALLVAEMQNQDPLEPTSNTEWVSQYATFTQVEQISEMATTLDVMRANSLVGKDVIMRVQNESTGEISYTRGTVDYITMEEGKALLNIGGNNFSIDNLDTVASTEYFDAYDLYTDFANKVGAMPSSTNNLDLSYKNVLQEIYDMYEGMTDYQKGFVSTYAGTELEYFQSAVKVLEDMGASFTKEEEKQTTLDDLLNAFNTKMDSLVTQVSELNEKVKELEDAQKTE